MTYNFLRLETVKNFEHKSMYTFYYKPYFDIINL